MVREEIYTLGINCAHDASACLLKNGQVSSAIKEERLTRRKHQSGFPVDAINYCLNNEHINNEKLIANVVVSKPPALAIPHLKDGFCFCDKCFSKKIINPSHHLLHAYYAWMSSGFDEAVIIIVDGSGYNFGEYKRRGSSLIGNEPPFSEMEEAESIYHAKENRIEIINKKWGLWKENSKFRFRFPSLGHMFSLASQYIFGSWKYAGKVMGLAPYGNKDAFPFNIIELNENEGIKIDTDWILRFNSPTLNNPKQAVKEYCDIAAKVQHELEKAMLFLAHKAYEITKCPNLCISGGVGLNSVNNGRILKEGPFKKMFITPAAEDSGIAVGAALYGYHKIGEHSFTMNYKSDFHGKEYKNEEIIEILNNNSCITYKFLDNPEYHAAKDISEGKIIAWFEGSSEFGPRALGHRSILCDPGIKEMKDILNTKVKFRESFRPYAGSMLLEHISEFFDTKHSSPFMLIVHKIKKEKRKVIPAICHVDGSCRIQTVDEKYDGKFYSLIKNFYQLKGIPIVLNTSFNVRGEPIVESPIDALRCFLSTGIDILYIEKYRITKTVIDFYRGFSNIKNLIPCINECQSINSFAKFNSDIGKFCKERFTIETRTGFKMSINRDEYRVLVNIDGKCTLEEIKYKLLSEARIFEIKRNNVDTLLETTLKDLQEKGLISFKSL
jgi:carbamoyltransferase